MKASLWAGMTFMTGIASAGVVYASRTDPALAMTLGLMVSIIGGAIMAAAGDQP